MSSKNVLLISTILGDFSIVLFIDSLSYSKQKGFLVIILSSQILILKSYLSCK